MKKRLFLVCSLGVILVAGVGGGCAVAVTKVARRIFNFQFSIFNWDFKVFRWCTNGLPVAGQLEKMLEDKTYIVLLQNNTELRATGGFMGSYARIRTQGSGIREIKVQDIYVPDGQIVGHVEPPYPVQEAFLQGWWKLRDANWDPDFASAAATIAWFMEQGGEPAIDGIVAVNLITAQKLMGIFGPLKLQTYDEMVTEQNFGQLAQARAEMGFKPGSTQKQDFLGAVAVGIEERVKTINLIDLIVLINLTKDQVDKGQILMWAKDPELQGWVERLGWGGRLEDGWDPSASSGQDYLYIVENNLGANKANCCVTRRVTQEIGVRNQESETRLIIEWANDNPYPVPKPPEAWGGDYWNYVRIVIPRENKITGVRVQGRELRRAEGGDFGVPNSLRREVSKNIYVIEKRRGLQIIGFWAIVPAKSSMKAEVVYDSGFVNDEKRILVKRQPGIDAFFYKLVYNGRVRAAEMVSRDREFVMR